MGRILVVDDESHSREGLRDSLARDGHAVETAADGWQAIRKIKEGRFDLAVIDLDLAPYQGVALTGWDLARIVRAYHPGLPIIILAAEEWRPERRQAEDLRVSQVLEKPISLAELKALARAHTAPAARTGAPARLAGAQAGKGRA